MEGINRENDLKLHDFFVSLFVNEDFKVLLAREYASNADHLVEN